MSGISPPAKVLFAGYGDDVFEFDQRHGVIVMLFTSGMQAAFVEVVSDGVRAQIRRAFGSPGGCGATHRSEIGV
jgi:hypothetical protein